MQYTPRRKLTREFKLEAVRQVALSEKPKAQLARELGVRVGQLRTWRLEFEKEAVTGIARPDRAAVEDLEQLRRENAKLKMEIMQPMHDGNAGPWHFPARSKRPHVQRGARMAPASSPPRGISYQFDPSIMSGGRSQLRVACH